MRVRAALVATAVAAVVPASADAGARPATPRGGTPAARVLEDHGRWDSLAAGAEERFRAGFMADETPAFTRYRVRIVEDGARRSLKPSHARVAAADTFRRRRARGCHASSFTDFVRPA